MKTCALFILLAISFVSCSRIFFPTSTTTRSNECFLSQHNEHGICSLPQDCALFGKLIEFNKFSDLLCKPGDVNLICCPHRLDIQPEEIFDISKPASAEERCGSLYYVHSVDLFEFYANNKTAEDLEKEGFHISEHLVYGDLLDDFRITNSTFTNYFRRFFPFDAAGIGGENARRIVTVYMALLGKRDSNGITIDWFCDGVLINSEWILTAAHCFARDIDVVRLGEYDLATTEPSSVEDPQDYGIKRFILYPKYKFPAAYHDLALIQLSRRTYISRPDIRPICLPWGTESKVPLLNRQITLTGWGATFYGGPISNIPQEVNVTVLEIAKCEKGYSTLRDYAEKFPSGMRSNNILCAGSEEGGRDACQGDSGGPVVYLSDDFRYTLAGIVSTGSGCGQKEFPGIYTKIAIPEYLNWIKTTAFSD